MDNTLVSQIVAKYDELGNVWKVGEVLGLSGQKVHSILKSMGLGKRMNYFTDNDYQFLKEHYDEYAQAQNLKELAQIMDRTVPFLSRKAKELGLTKNNRKFELGENQVRKLSESARMRIKTYGHPKGMLGKKHSNSTKQNISLWQKQNWDTHYDEILTDERRKQMSDLMAESQELGKMGVRSRTYLTQAIINNKEYLFKSAWETNIAMVLEYCRLMGEIDDWGYESSKFSFEYDGSGVRNYKPDFDVIKDGITYHIEVKGWKDDKSQVKEILMKKHYPNVQIYLIDEPRYRDIKKRYKPIIPLWGFSKTIDNDNKCVKIVAEKFVDKDNPRVEFKIVTID